MVRRIIFSLMWVTLTASAGVAQVYRCPSNGYDPRLDRPATPHAVGILRQVYGDLCPNGCGSLMLAENSAVDGAFLILRDGESRLVYCAHFMNWVHQTHGQDAAYGVIAHEFGHFIGFKNPGAWDDHSWSRELRVDAWAGCALARANLDRAAMEGSLQAIAALPSPSHPSWLERVPALRTGYVQCGGSNDRWPSTAGEDPFAPGIARIAEHLVRGVSSIRQLRGRRIDGELHVSLISLPGLDCTYGSELDDIACSAEFEDTDEAEALYEALLEAAREALPGWDESRAEFSSSDNLIFFDRSSARISVDWKERRSEDRVVISFGVLDR